jgi:hypothetical protein
MNTPLRVPPRGPRPRWRTRVPHLVATTLTLLLALGLTAGCSGDGDHDGRSGRPASGTTETATTASVAGPAPVTTRAEIGTLVGRLPGDRRQAVRRQVTEVLDRWWDTAYVGGSYPRTDFDRYPGFTPGASRRATYDRDLMSNADIGDRVRSVTPLMRRARLDLLSVDRRVRSVTARFDLRMRVALVDAGADASDPEVDTRSRRLQVRGRVFLTRQPAGWRVFGYDVRKGWLR